MPLDNRVYDYLKWVALIGLPAMSVLLGGLGEIYAWSHADTTVQLMQLITVFLGSILQLSSHYYRDDDDDAMGPRLIA